MPKPNPNAERKTAGKSKSLALLLNIALVPLFASLAGCQDPTATESEAAKPVPDVVNTAEVYNPDVLQIIAPKNTLPGNSTLIQVAENSTDVIQVRAQDKPGSTLLYRLRDGEDLDKFSIDEKTGDLTFKEAPDWEQPGDANQDNNYMVLWQVVSSNGGALNQFMVVKVTDLPD